MFEVMSFSGYAPIHPPETEASREPRLHRYLYKG